MQSQYRGFETETASDRPPRRHLTIGRSSHDRKRRNHWTALSTAAKRRTASWMARPLLQPSGAEPQSARFGSGSHRRSRSWIDRNEGAEMMISIRCGTLATVLVSAMMASSAKAELVQTPVGKIDKSCIHEVPHGAHVNPETGDVFDKDNKFLEHHGPCGVPWVGDDITGKGNGHAAKGGQAPDGPWYEQVTASPLSGSPGFDSFAVNFQVPPNPTNNGALIYLWPGLENLSSTNWVTVIQPVLQWGNNGTFGGNYWVISSWGVVNGGNAYHSPPLNTSAGYSLQGYLYQTGPINWQIQTVDFTNGYYTYLNWTSRTYWPQYNWAQMGVLEIYNLSNCNQLPNNFGMYFFLQQAYEQGPYWNSFNNVTNSLSWSGGSDGKTPSCGWGAGYLPAYNASFLNWLN
jgi:hypothetical protein